MSSLGKLGALGVIVLVLGLELRAVLGPHEDWPFTSAPMFARYVAPGDPLYELRIFLERPDGSERELSPRRDLGLGELGFRRQLFARYYGSTDPRHPSGHHPGDTPERFRERLRDFMHKLASVHARRGSHPVVAYRLEVWKLENERVERRPLVRYDVALRELALLGSWGPG